MWKNSDALWVIPEDVSWTVPEASARLFLKSGFRHHVNLQHTKTCWLSDKVFGRRRPCPGWGGGWGGAVYTRGRHTEEQSEGDGTVLHEQMGWWLPVQVVSCLSP